MPERITLRDRFHAALFGAVCHGIFIVAVWSMFWGIAEGLNSGRGTLTGIPALITNIFLLLQFPLGHSFFLSEQGRDLLTRAGGKLGHQLTTTTFALLSSCQLVLVFTLWSPSGVTLFSFDSPLRECVFVIYLSSWLFLARTMFDAGVQLQTGALGWWSVFRKKAPSYPPMPICGTFRYVRQPIYLAFAAILWSAPAGTLDRIALAVLWTLYLLLGPRLKERRFERFFGDAFRNYRRDTPYFLPRFRSVAVQTDRSIPHGPSRLKEFEDLRWIPSWWRDLMTDCLRFIMKTTAPYHSARPILHRALSHTSKPAILDFGSGAGGPLPELYAELQKSFPNLSLTLTDKFPHLPTAYRMNGEAERTGEQIRYRIESVDITGRKPLPAGVRTMFTSFHHLGTSDAALVLKQAANDREPLAIFEITGRSPFHFATTLLIPIAILLFTPFIRPWSLQRMVATYLIPIVPFGCLWDGVISNLRTFSVKDLRSLADAAENHSYRFEVGTFPGFGPVRGTYLLGFPVD